jgi:hypothetical protein
MSRSSCFLPGTIPRPWHRSNRDLPPGSPDHGIVRLARGGPSTSRPGTRKASPDPPARSTTSPAGNRDRQGCSRPRRKCGGPGRKRGGNSLPWEASSTKRWDGATPSRCQRIKSWIRPSGRFPGTAKQAQGVVPAGLPLGKPLPPRRGRHSMTSRHTRPVQLPAPGARPQRFGEEFSPAVAARALENTCGELTNPYPEHNHVPPKAEGDRAPGRGVPPPA